MVAPPCILHSNHMHALNLGCWECSIIPTQGTNDYKNIGPVDWPRSYKRLGA
jgi:hypothetical protein